MKQYEASAKTVEEAIEIGLQELGVSIGDVDVQVIEEGSKGLFGLFGSRPVKVRLTLKDSGEDPLADREYRELEHARAESQAAAKDFSKAQELIRAHHMQRKTTGGHARGAAATEK